MPKSYGKLVDSLLTKAGKTWVRSSTYIHARHVYIDSVGAQVRLLPTIVPRFYTYISPANFTPLPLIEHIFYPVSTGPITNLAKEKIKER